VPNVRKTRNCNYLVDSTLLITNNNNTFSSQKLISALLFAKGAIVTRFLPR